MDPYIVNVQEWVNQNFKGEPGYEEITVTGKTGWTTIYALVHALQITLNVGAIVDNFGPSTENSFKEYISVTPLVETDPDNRVDPLEFLSLEELQALNTDDMSEENKNKVIELIKYRRIVGIVQGALLCKGYSIGTNKPTGNFYSGTGNAIRNLKEDAGVEDTTSYVTVNVMKALMSMDYFYSYDNSTRTKNIIEMQRYLNKNYEDYIGLCPCDGVYGRRTNKALIYAIQAEEGMSTSVANGNCGPSTKSCLPTLSVEGTSKGTSYNGSSYSSEKIEKFKILANMLLYFNGFGDGTISSTLKENTISQFQTKYVIPVTGEIDYTTWLSLLISCGDTERPASACDCATILTKEKAKTLYDNGYRIVGRYLSGYIASGESKALTIDELKIAVEAGLRIFPIYQQSANSVSYFTVQRATNDLLNAFDHASKLGLPSGTSIYFAVDCDPQESEITDYIIPYFKILSSIMKDSLNNKYPVSIYGTRNVCSKVSNAGYAKYSFVSDMSTGFSGNLGFCIPDNWAFDQFTTIKVGSGDGKIEIDKDATSGKDLGLGGDLYLTDIGKVYYSLLDMYNLALQYTDGDKEKSNMLVLQYIRKERYGDTSIFRADDVGEFIDNIRWDVVAGTIDTKYCELVDEKLYNLTFDFEDDSYEDIVNHDFPHLAAVLNALLYKIGNVELNKFDQIVDSFAGWGGDTISFATAIKIAFEEDGEYDYEKWAKEHICRPGDKFFDSKDYIDDIDAYNLFDMIYTRNFTLPEAFLNYYILPLSTGICAYKAKANIFIQCMTVKHFNELCELINSNESPIKELRGTITKAEQKYIDTAIDSFKNHLYDEINAGR